MPPDRRSNPNVVLYTVQFPKPSMDAIDQWRNKEMDRIYNESRKVELIGREEAIRRLCAFALSKHSAEGQSGPTSETVTVKTARGGQPTA